MMIWTGWGVLAGIIPFIGISMGAFIFELVLGVGYHFAAKASMIFVSSYAVWVLGRKLNGSGRFVFDPQIGGEIWLKNNYTFF